jgi:hypothetical protein
MSQDLAEFLQSYSGPVLVNLWEGDCSASREMEQRMQELESLTSIPVLRLAFPAYREWARAHDVYGTPALIAYHHGHCLFRLLGSTTVTVLLQRLRAYGL